MKNWVEYCSTEREELKAGLRIRIKPQQRKKHPAKGGKLPSGQKEDKYTVLWVWC